LTGHLVTSCGCKKKEILAEVRRPNFKRMSAACRRPEVIEKIRSTHIARAMTTGRQSARRWKDPNYRAKVQARQISQETRKIISARSMETWARLTLEERKSRGQKVWAGRRARRGPRKKEDRVKNARELAAQMREAKVSPEERARRKKKELATRYTRREEAWMNDKSWSPEEKQLIDEKAREHGRGRMDAVHYLRRRWFIGETPPPMWPKGKPMPKANPRHALAGWDSVVFVLERK
jgi:hypothetical protein